MSSDILEKLYKVLLARKNANGEESYVASLYQKGTSAIAGKLIEETIETIAEALKDDKDALRAESADLLFHLMVLWADRGVKPPEILKILEERFGTGGLAEKAARPKNGG